MYQDGAGPRTLQDVRQRNDFRAFPEVPAFHDGQDGPVVSTLLARLTRTRPDEMMSFVGRQPELERLDAAIAAAVRESRGRTLFIEGPAGVGKTTLVTELLSRISIRERYAMGRGRCTQTFGGGEPYLPFIEALSDLADESTPGSVQRATVSGLVRELAPYWLQVVPLVGGLLAATFATATEVQDHMKRSSAPSREALFMQYLDVVRRLAADTPFLLFLDDLHWADHASIALLGYLSRGIGELPVVIIATMRELQVEHDDPALIELVLELEREDIATRVKLAELDGGSLDLVLQQEFGGEVSVRLRRWVEKTAGGNPLFVTELAKLLRQSGGAVEIDGEWQLTDSAESTEVPRSAEAVIERRIQRLEPAELNLLQYASVGGAEFDSVVLARLLDVDELVVLDMLEPLDRKHGLIDAVGEVELPNGEIASEYRFRHPLVHTVLYRQVVGKRRILVHRKAGETIASLWGENTNRVAPQLARHFDQGRVRDRAHKYAMIAADAAAAVFANWEALDLFDVALRNVEPGREAEVHERCADLHDRIGQYTRAVEEYAFARAKSAEATGLRLARKTLTVQRKAGLAPAPTLVARLTELLERTENDPTERCHLLLELTRLPDANRDAGHSIEAVRIAESLGNPLLLVDALERVAVRNVFVEGRVEEEFEPLRRALEVAFSIQDPVLLARYHAIAGVANAKMGRYRDALDDFGNVLTAFERMGDPNGIAAACHNLGMVMLRVGVFADAERMLERARTIHERRDRASIVQSLFGLAECARLQDDPGTAAERFEYLLEHAVQLQLWQSEAVARGGLGLCFLARDRREEAEEQAAALRTLLAASATWFEDRDIPELFLARLDAAAGDALGADVRLERIASAVRSRDVYLWARTIIERAELAMPFDQAEATAIIVSAGDAIARIQSPPLHTRLAALRSALAA